MHGPPRPLDLLTSFTQHCADCRFPLIEVLNTYTEQLIERGVWQAYDSVQGGGQEEDEEEEEEEEKGDDA